MGSCPTNPHTFRPLLSPPSLPQGWAAPSLPSSASASPSSSPSMAPLLDLIVRHVPPPPSARAEQPFAMGVTWVERDPYIGRIVTGTSTGTFCTVLYGARAVYFTLTWAGPN